MYILCYLHERAMLTRNVHWNEQRPIYSYPWINYQLFSFSYAIIKNRETNFWCSLRVERMLIRDARPIWMLICIVGHTMVGVLSRIGKSDNNAAFGATFRSSSCINYRTSASISKDRAREGSGAYERVFVPKDEKGGKGNNARKWTFNSQKG